MTEDIPLIDPPVQSMKLADGRDLTWQEFGTPDGNPALYFHGGGSFSVEAGVFHREAVRNNIRLISTNRPGVGGTSLFPGRPVADYSNDLVQLVDKLQVDKFACFGESNGGMITLAVSATLTRRVVGGVPINPTVPWFDPVARRVSSASAATGYRLMKYAPRLLVWATERMVPNLRGKRSEAPPVEGGFNPAHLVGPPPGTEEDVGEIQWRFMAHVNKQALLAELEWAASDWGFDFYFIPVPLDFFCGVHDPQAPFALVLADQNPDARFHYFSYGHHGFSHPDARRRILDKIAGYFEA